MGTGAKIALVALLIVMVLVVAKVVQNSGDEENPAAPSKIARNDPKAKTGATTPKKVTAAAKKAPTRTRRVDVFRRPKLNTSGGYRRNDSGNSTATSPARPNRSVTSDGGVATGRKTTGTGTAPPLPSNSTLEGFGGETAPSGTTVPSGTDAGVGIRTTPDTTGQITPPLRVTNGTRATPPATAGTRLRSANIPTRRPNGSVPSPLKLPTLPVKAPAVSSDASGTTAAAGFPRKHTVRSGENYWLLAKKYYGQGRLYKSILEANHDVKLEPGVIVTIPPSPAPANSVTPAPAPTTGPATRNSTVGKKGSVQRNSVERTPSDAKYFYYTVRRGETLSGIAKKFYGNGKAYRRIQDANRALRYETLRAGEKIRIPKL